LGFLLFSSEETPRYWRIFYEFIFNFELIFYLYGIWFYLSIILILLSIYLSVSTGIEAFQTKGTIWPELDRQKLIITIQIKDR